MDGPRHERRNYFRGKARPGRVLPVRYKTTLHPGWIAAETRNIGVGGAFIASTRVQPVGTAMTIELTLPTSDEVFTMPAIVRWSREDVGMGIQFVGVEIQVVLELNDYFSSLTA